MPKQKNNIVMHSTRGMFGKQVVFKRRNGESYVAAPPEVDENRKPTELQSAVRSRFVQSVKYASIAIKDAIVKLAYQAVAKRNQSAQNVAFLDAFNAPKVSGVITQGYRGLVGDIIVVQATDDFKVNAVKIAIHNSAGDLVEEGNAIEEANGSNWTYVITQANASIAGTKITATATDLPGNETSLDVTV